MDTSEITLPVSREVAERWRAPDERARLGAVLSMALIAGGSIEDAAAAAARLATGTPEERRDRLRELGGRPAAGCGRGRHHARGGRGGAGGVEA